MNKTQILKITILFILVFLNLYFLFKSNSNYYKDNIHYISELKNKQAYIDKDFPNKSGTLPDLFVKVINHRYGKDVKLLQDSVNVGINNLENDVNKGIGRPFIK